MLEKRWRYAVATALVAGLGGLAACGDDDDDGGKPKGEKASLQLTIGGLLPLSGDLSDFGPPGRKAADLAVDRINASIRQSGSNHRVRLVSEDTQTKAQPAVQAARKVLADDASCIAGPWSSDEAIPVGRSVSTREEVLQISPSATSDEITDLEDDGLVNRTSPPDSFQGTALADAVAEDVGGARGKTVNIGARNDAYGTGLAETFAEAWEKKGGEIGERVVYDPEQPSYNSEAARIVSGNPDRFVIIDFPETYVKVGPALVRTGRWDAKKTWVPDGLQSGDLPKTAGRRATEGIRGSFPGTPERGEAPEAFNRLYERAGGPRRGTFDAQNFDAVVLCYLAAVAAGSTNGPDMAEQVRQVSNAPGRKYTFRELPQAVKALENGEDIDYEGASGPIDMNDKGDPTAGVYDIFRYRGGEVDIFDEVPLSKDKLE